LLRESRRSADRRLVVERLGERRADVREEARVRLLVLALGDFVFQLLHEQGVVEGSADLTRQELERMYALGRERIGGEVVLEVEHADRTSRPSHRHGEHGFDAVLLHVGIGAETTLSYAIAEWVDTRHRYLLAVARAVGVTVPQPDHADDGCVVTSNTIRGYVGHHDPDLDHRINQLHADARMDCPPARAAAASPAARSTGRRPA